MRGIALFLLSACIAGSALAQTTPPKPAMLMPGTGKIQIGLGGRGDYKRAEKGAPANASAAIDYYNGANPEMVPPGNGQADPSAAAAQAKSTPAAPQLHSDSKLPGDGDKARVIQAQKDKAAQAKAVADSYAKAQAAALAKQNTPTTTSGTSGTVGAPTSY